MSKTTIFHNGKIYTLDQKNSIADSMLVTDGKIVAIGNYKDIESLMDESTEKIDLGQSVVLPSLIDCHVHLLGTGYGATMINCSDKSKQEIIKLVQEKALSTSAGKWIIGLGWNQDFWDDKRFPSKEELDVVSPNNPVKLIRYCGNAYWCNSMALKLADLTSEKTGNAGKEYLLNEKGELSGVLVGEACRKIDNAIPKRDYSDTVSLIRHAEKYVFENGVTCIMDKGAGGESALSYNCGRELVKILEDLYSEGSLKMRIYEAIIGEDEYFEDCFKNGKRMALFDDKLTIRGIKLWSDGAFGPRSAWLKSEYKNGIGHSGNQKFTDSELIHLFKKADSKDLQIAIHTIGDASTEQILNCYEKAFSDSLDKDRRFIMDHVHVPQEKDITRMAKYKIINSTQFIQLSSDMDVIQDILSDEMITRLYPWRSVANSGVLITNGSDSPVDPIAPFESLYVAISRKSINGNNCIEDEPYRTLTREEAIRAYTTNAAYSMYCENKLGSLEPGKYADFIIIDRDYFTCSLEEIKDIKVVKTALNGNYVYER